MKKLIVRTPIIMLALVLAGCGGGETKQTTDTTTVPPATDTMPVLNPGIFDSSGTIRTPPTNDENVIMPDSAIKPK